MICVPTPLSEGSGPDLRAVVSAARSVARLYDALHEAQTREILVSPTDTGSGSFTHKFFRVARSREDVVGQRDAIAAWARTGPGQEAVEIGWEEARDL